MSCIRFNTPAQRSQMRESQNGGSLGLSSEDAAVLHLSPPVTESKIARLRLLAKHENPAIRQSVASNRNTPEDLFATLAADTDASVRACVARNEATPCDVLSSLATDPSDEVRSWLAVNYFVPQDAFEILTTDRSAAVRSLVGWKRSLAEA